MHGGGHDSRCKAMLWLSSWSLWRPTGGGGSRRMTGPHLQRWMASSLYSRPQEEQVFTTQVDVQGCYSAGSATSRCPSNDAARVRESGCWASLISARIVSGETPVSSASSDATGAYSRLDDLTVRSIIVDLWVYHLLMVHNSPSTGLISRRSFSTPSVS